MSTSNDRRSRKANQPRLSDQLKASDLFPPGTGWNNSPAMGAEVRRDDMRPAPRPNLEPRQH